MTRTDVFSAACLLLAIVLTLPIVLTAAPAQAQALGAGYTTANPANNDLMGVVLADGTWASATWPTHAKRP
jgi:hypothetical protein